ncbi:MAG: ketol-acid reductoisomerase [Candidatus Latescibacteria bacterium]|nr:ketol-acid reductoisomerase [Candidatus Latescibacterota bacterium]
MQPPWKSRVFPLQAIDLAGTREYIVRGGHDRFPLLPQALAGIEQIGVIGWGPQGAAQAQNLRDSLRGTPIKVKVGLRPDSPSAQDARAKGFCETDDTLGPMETVIGESDLVLLLIADAAQAAHYPQIFAGLKPGVTLGLSHGFLLGHLQNQNVPLPDHFSLIAVCPKGMGPSVRRLYEQGQTTQGAGINASFAVVQDLDGRATDQALGWALAIGAPYTFRTTLEREYLSDIFGERGILLGAVHGLVESLYRHYRASGDSDHQAFIRACESLTAPLARSISRRGLLATYQGLKKNEQTTFAQAFCASYTPCAGLLLELYDEVENGNELRSVCAAAARASRYPMGRIDAMPMWRVGQQVRAERAADPIPLDPFTAGLYCAAMTAQIDILREKGHAWSEIANESVIEAVDSLLPYMHHQGVAHMIDNCSNTARLGARKWAPRFDYALSQEVYPVVDNQPIKDDLFTHFLQHPVHDVLQTCAALRPSVDILGD